MNKWVFLICILLILPSLEGLSQETQKATGVVFVDTNENRVFDEGEQTLPGIRVSNGSDIVLTDDHGHWVKRDIHAR